MAGLQMEILALRSRYMDMAAILPVSYTHLFMEVYLLSFSYGYYHNVLQDLFVGQLHIT